MGGGNSKEYIDTQLKNSCKTHQDSQQEQLKKICETHRTFQEEECNKYRVKWENLEDKFDNLERYINQIQIENSKLVKLLGICGHCGGDCDILGNCTDGFGDSSESKQREKERLDRAGIKVEATTSDE